jgi:ATP-binding cassette subfamily F protein 3
MNFLRGLAGAFLFSGADQHKPIKALSGGERSRVALARMLVEPANTLLLDEPTNHLDPPSVDILTDALGDFPGTLVFISHDPVFLTRVATRVVEIEDGKARDYLGDYEYYLWKRAQELESIKERSEELGTRPVQGPRLHRAPSPAPPSPEAPSRNQRRRELSKAQARLEKQVSRLEGEIGEMERRIKERDRELADPALYQDFGWWHELHQEQDRWRLELDRMTGKWEALCQELEAVRQQLTVRGLG